MLITIYNNSNATDFTQDFNENIILPKMTTLKLTNALIPLSHKFILEQDEQLNLRVNQKVGGENLQVILNRGSYTLPQLAKSLEDVLQSKLDEKLSRIKADVTYDLGKGYGAGVFHIKLSSQSFNYNQFLMYAFGTNNFNNSVSKNDALVGTFTIQKNYVADPESNIFGIKTLQDGGGGNISSWGALQFLNLPLQFWLDPNKDGTTNQPPSLHNSEDSYASVSWTNQKGTTKTNYILGVSNGTNPIATGVSANTFDKFIEIGNASILFLVINVTNGTYNEGEVYIYENAGDGGGYREIGRWKDPTNPVGDGSQFGITLTDGHAPAYWFKVGGATQWVNQNQTDEGKPRVTISRATQYKVFLNSYGATGNTDADANIKDIRGTFRPNNLFVNDFGKYIAFGFQNTDFQDDMGFDKQNYEADTIGANPPTLAVLEEDNENKMEVKGEEDGFKKCPYVNIQIQNLPIVSYSNTDTLKQGLTCSKVLASIPRYDEMGNMDNIENLTHSPTIPNEIQLNNKEEISISQLHFKLQQADGLYPVDLDVPQGFVIDVQSQGSSKY